MLFPSLQAACWSSTKLTIKISNCFGFGRQQTSFPSLKIPNTLPDTHTSHDLILHLLHLLLEPIILYLLYRISNSSHGNLTLQMSMTLRIQLSLKKSISQCNQRLQNCSSILNLIWQLTTVLAKYHISASHKSIMQNFSFLLSRHIIIPHRVNPPNSFLIKSLTYIPISQLTSSK